MSNLYRRVELADGHVKYDPVDDEIERLRVVLQKIAGVREYDRADYVAANKYKPDEGLWTVDEYLADSALSPA